MPARTGFESLRAILQALDGGNTTSQTVVEHPAQLER